MTKRQKNRQHNGQKKKNRQHNGQKKKYRQHNGQKTEEQTTQWPKDRRTKYKQRSKNIHRKPKIEQHEPHLKP